MSLAKTYSDDELWQQYRALHSVFQGIWLLLSYWTERWYSNERACGYFHTTWQQLSAWSNGFRMLKIFRHIKVTGDKDAARPITSKRSVYAIFTVWVLQLAASCSKWTALLGWFNRWKQTSTWGTAACQTLEPILHGSKIGPDYSSGFHSWLVFPKLSSARIRAEGSRVYFYASCFT